MILSMITPLTDFLLAAVHTLGMAALFVIFVLKGALVGKVLPTSVVVPGYVVAAAPTYADAVILVVVLTIAYIVGQLVVYLGTRRYGRSFLSSIPYVTIDPESDRLKQFDRWFDRYGGLSVFATSIFPWTRGLIAIPAGVSEYPTGRYVAHITTASLVYHAAYVAVPLFGIALLA